MSWLIQMEYFEHREGVNYKEIKLIKEANSFDEAKMLAQRWINYKGYCTIRIMDLTITDMKVKPWLDIKED